MSTNPLALAAYQRTQVATTWHPEEREANDKAVAALALKARINRRLERVA